MKQESAKMKTQKPKGGPAFPVSGEDCYLTGLSARDFFAAAALAGASYDGDGAFSSVSDVARYCYALADAMIAEREASNG